MHQESLFLRPEDSFWRAPSKGVRFAVLAAVLFGVGFVIFGEKPWGVAEAAEKRRAAGEKPLLDHDITRGLWYGFSASAIAGVFLLATWQRWSRLAPPARAVTMRVERLVAPAFWILLLVAVALGGFVRWNLANRSLWWDEIWSVKHASLGYLKSDGEPESGDFRFLKRDWATTLWEYRKPTNHPPVSAASRISQTIWRNSTDAEGHEFNELAVRAPTLAAGLLSIFAIGVLVRRWGFAIGGIAAAFFLAIHPWHMRYGTEARAYSFAVLWTILGCLWLTYALSDERGRWRFWLLFGLNQLLLTWSLPNGFYYATGFVLAAAVVAFYQWPKRDDRIAALWRLIAVNVMAAMAFFPLFVPNLLQALRWGEINDHAMLTMARFKDTLCQLAFGMNIAQPGGVEGEGIPSYAREVATTPWILIPTLALLLIGLLVGVIRLAMARPGAVAILGSIVIAATVYLTVTVTAGHFFYPRYIIYLIVPFSILFGIGLAGFSRALTPKPTASALVGIAVLSLYAVATRAPRDLLFNRPYAPFRDVAEHLEERASEAEGLRTIAYGLGGRMLVVYYPQARFAKNKDELEQAIAAAEAAGEPHVIVLGYEGFNRAAPAHRDGFDIIDREGSYVEARHFEGIDPLFYFRVLESAPPAGGAINNNQ